ncbi:MAG: ADP-ribosylglycohydrolase family protein [Syntrophomonadaceae bacterium]
MNKQQLMGGLLGVIVGDALGLPVQFASRQELKLKPVKDMKGWGVSNMPSGSFSDDGSLTLCLAESLTEVGLNPEDAAQRFLRWYNEGYWTPTGFAYDIGRSTARAMENLNNGVAALEAGPSEVMDNGNGSLMRILPAALYLAGETPAELALGIWDMSRITHGHPLACSACYLYALMVRELLTGVDPREAYAKLCTLPEEVLAAGIAPGERQHFARILEGKLYELPEEKIKSTGYVIDTLEAALWCLLLYNDFASTILAAVNLGDDTDTVAAVSGGLAGIVYCLEGIPEGWRQQLIRRDEILVLAERFADKVIGCSKLSG